eukprot:sb/3474540/
MTLIITYMYHLPGQCSDHSSRSLRKMRIGSGQSSDSLGAMANKMLEREVAILKRVQHPHIVALEEVYETSELLIDCQADALTTVLASDRIAAVQCTSVYLHTNSKCRVLQYLSGGVECTARPKKTKGTLALISPRI